MQHQGRVERLRGGQGLYGIADGYIAGYIEAKIMDF